MDEGDISSRVELEMLERSINSHTNRRKEQAEFGHIGEKICIDCGGRIPEARARLEFVVRCLYCQELEETRGNFR